MVEAGWFAQALSGADEEGLVRLFDELYDPAFLIDVEAGRFVAVHGFETSRWHHAATATAT